MNQEGTCASVRRTGLLCLAGTVVLLAVCSLRGDAREKTTEVSRPTGLIPSSVELAQPGAPHVNWITATHSGRSIHDAPPAQWQNIQHLPVVRAQTLANCGAFAPSYYYKTHQEAREHGWIRPDPEVNPERVMSPGFTYPLVNGGENSGAGLTTTLDVICRYGIATWDVMPERYDYTSYPADDVWERALPYRSDQLIGFDCSTSGGLTALKTHLASGDLAVIGTPVTFETHFGYPGGAGVDNGVIYTNAGAWASFHAFTLVGYDDNRAYNDGTGVKHGAFLAVNSWGQGWGVTVAEAGSAGFCWFSYDYMQNHRGLDTGAYATTDRIGYIPRETATIRLSQTHRDELYLGIEAGGSAANREAFPRRGGPLPYSGTITIDITELMPGDPIVYRLMARDLEPAVGGTPDTGKIFSFAVHKVDGTTITSQDAPADITAEHGLLAPIPLILRASMLPQVALGFDGEASREAATAWADFDLDGDPDLVVAGAPSRLFVNDGEGNLRDSGIVLPTFLRYFQLCATWADYDRDGYPDLLLAGSAPTNQPLARIYRNAAGRDLVETVILSPEADAKYAWGDLDNDGDLDVANSLGRVFYQSNGIFTAHATILALPSPQPRRTVAIVDIDNDGLMDIDLAGALYYNTGDGTFFRRHGIPSDDDIGGHTDEPTVWHDFDGDGTLDAFGGGLYLNSKGFTYYPKFIGGEVVFKWVWQGWESTNGVPWRSGGQFACGDFDNDGDMDVALSGSTTDSSEDLVCEVYRRGDDAVFRNIGASITGVMYGDLVWADWNGDGDLGLLISGNTGSVPGVPAYEAGIFYYESQYAEALRPNSPPDPPAGLTAREDGDYLLLSWEDAIDAETPAPGLWYDVRVGSRHDGVDIVSPPDRFQPRGNARHVGDLAVPATGVVGETWMNVHGQPGMRLRDLAPGRYYYAVRAVDTAYARSEWSGTRAFTLSSSGIVEGDVNADGFVDVSDLVRARKMVAGTVTPDLGRADMDSDGEITHGDAAIIAKRILSVPSDGFAPLTTGTIGPAGGTLARDGFELTVPPGTFPEPADLEILVSSEESWFGDSTPRMTYRIKGLPVDMQGALTMTSPDHRASNGVPPLLALGLTWRPYDVNNETLEPIRSFTSIPGATAPGNRLTAQIPHDLLTDGESTPAPSARGPVSPPTKAARFTFEIVAGYFSNSYRLLTPHCIVNWDGEAPSRIIDFASELENAFDQFALDGYKFLGKRNWTNHPYQVWIKNQSDNGGHVHRTDNGAFMGFNTHIVGDPVQRPTTLGHETFHLVQGLVNPASPTTEANDKELLFWCEATATWSEQDFAPNPATYCPTVYWKHALLLFNGLSDAGGSNAANEGYAFSALIEYLERRYTTRAFVKATFDGIAGGKAPLTAFFDALGQPATDWHHAFYESLLRGDFYRGATDQYLIARFYRSSTPLWPPRHQRHTVQDTKTTTASFVPHLLPMDAAGYQFKFAESYLTNLTDTSALAVSLSNPNGKTKVSVLSAKNTVEPPATAPVEYYGAKPEAMRCRVRGLNGLVQPVPGGPMRSFLPLVTRTDQANLRDTSDLQPRFINVGVVDALSGTEVIPSYQHHGNTIASLFHQGSYAFVDIPIFTCAATLGLPDLTGTMKKLDFFGYPSMDKNGPHYRFELWQDGPVSVTLDSFSAANTGPTTADTTTGPDGFTRFRFSHLNKIEVRKWRSLGRTQQQQPTLATYPYTAGMSLTLDDNLNDVLFSVMLYWSGTTQQYDRHGQPISDPLAFDGHASSALLVEMLRK
jgi:hypothetical protein